MNSHPVLTSILSLRAPILSGAGMMRPLTCLPGASQVDSWPSHGLYICLTVYVEYGPM